MPLSILKPGCNWKKEGAIGLNANSTDTQSPGCPSEEEMDASFQHRANTQCPVWLLCSSASLLLLLQGHLWGSSWVPQGLGCSSTPLVWHPAALLPSSPQPQHRPQQSKGAASAMEMGITTQVSLDSSQCV